EQILKVQVYRQLQVSMPVTAAKTAVADIVERLRQVSGQSPGAAGSSNARGIASQAELLERLQVALRPFNLYFEWPEVQKLRAQIQLLEAEHESGREAYALGQDAEAQLELVVQKLEDQLVLQARELGELREALEQVRSLGGQKVRRLETFVNQIESSQSERQLAPAEIERARRLARDLRKLMESSVYAEQVAKGVDLEGADEPQPPQSHSAYAIDVSHGDVSQAELLASDAQPPFDEASAEPGDSLVAGDGAGHGARAEHSEAPAHHGASADDHVEHESPAFSSADSEAATATRATDTFDDGVLDVDGEEEDLLSIDTSVLDPEVHQRLR